MGILHRLARRPNDAIAVDQGSVDCPITGQSQDVERCYACTRLKSVRRGGSDTWITCRVNTPGPSDLMLN